MSRHGLTIDGQVEMVLFVERANSQRVILDGIECTIMTDKIGKNNTLVMPLIVTEKYHMVHHRVRVDMIENIGSYIWATTVSQNYRG